jgi:DNA-binding transcriptional LysR family regulator
VNEKINLARVDLTSMRLVVLCAELGSLTLAAPHAFLSVSGASHRLQQFEDMLDAPVFTRHRRGLLLTHLGEQVIPLCREILSLTENLLQSARCPHVPPRDAARATSPSLCA